MLVTKQHAGRVVATLARCKRYNIPDSKLKGLGLRIEPRRQDGVATRPGMCRQWLAALRAINPSD